MRWIRKSKTPPKPLDDYLTAQLPTGVNLSYESIPGLLDALTEEQYGLCAFTGSAVDDRIENVDTSIPEAVDDNHRVRIKNHVAHLKPQSVCRNELVAAGKEPGKDIGEDMDHNNMVAALEVNGTPNETFGAAAAGNWWDPNDFVKPTDKSCEGKFLYSISGKIDGTDQSAKTFIGKLKLDHRTLDGLRSSTIQAFFNPENPDDFRESHFKKVISAMDIKTNNKLPEFSFVIKHVAEDLYRKATE